MTNLIARRRTRFVEEVRGYHVDVAPTPVTTPAPKFRPAYPGVAVDALAELRAADAPISPTALRKSYDSRTWLPTAAGLRSVPLLDDLDDVVADIRAYIDQAPYVRHEDALRMALAPIAAMLDQAVTL